MALRALQGPTGGGTPVGGTGTTNTIPRWTGPSTLGDSGLIDNGTAIYTTTRNVGIGTANPLGPLDTRDATGGVGIATIYTGAITANVGGKISFGGYFTGVAPTTWASIVGGKDNNTDGNFAGHLQFLTRPSGGSQTERARIDSAGRFGIGTASPDSTLHVVGAASTQLRIGFNGLSQNSYDAGDHFFRSSGGSLTRWQINTSGHFLAGADNSYDIGASGATRPRTIYTGSDSYINSARVGLGSGNVSTNAVLGGGALGANTTGAYNTAVGYEALKANTDNSANTAVGYRALLTQGASAYQNTAIGAEALSANTTGVNNTALGRNAGNTTTTGQSNIFLGVNAVAGAAGDSNKLVVGSSTQWVATNGGATTYYATAGALAGYIIVRLNGADVKLPVYAL